MPVRSRGEPMIHIEDFTKLAPGVKIALEGCVGRCPRCGRNGVAQNLGDGTAYVVHIQTSQVLGDGMLTEPSDYCFLEKGDRAPVSSEPALNGAPESPPAPGARRVSRRPTPA